MEPTSHSEERIDNHKSSKPQEKKTPSSSDNDIGSCVDQVNKRRGLDKKSMEEDCPSNSRQIQLIDGNREIVNRQTTHRPTILTDCQNHTVIIDAPQNLLLPTTPTIQNQQHLNVPFHLLSSFPLDTLGAPVSVNPFLVHGRTTESSQRHDVQYLELLRNRSNPYSLASNLLANTNHRLVTSFAQNIRDNSNVLSPGNVLLRAAAINNILNPLQRPEGLTASNVSMSNLRDHPEPLATTIESIASHSQKQKLNILRTNPALLLQTRPMLSQSQGPLSAAASFLQASATSRRPEENSIITPDDSAPEGEIDTPLTHKSGRSNMVSSFDAASPSVLAPSGQISPISSKSSSLGDSFHIPNRKKRKRSTENSDSDSNGDESLDSSSIFHGNILVALPEDANVLTKSRCIIRSQIEFFSATKEDVMAIKNGRNNPPKVGQVGIRCIHCKHLSYRERPIRAAVFPSSLSQIYMAVKNWQHFHFNLCAEIPEECREQFAAFNTKKKRVGGSGSAYWEDAARELGIVECTPGLFFGKDPKKS